jgi:hypothetical protein
VTVTEPGDVTVTFDQKQIAGTTLRVIGTEEATIECPAATWLEIDGTDFLVEAYGRTVACVVRAPGRASRFVTVPLDEAIHEVELGDTRDAWVLVVGVPQGTDVYAFCGDDPCEGSDGQYSADGTFSCRCPLGVASVEVACRIPFECDRANAILEEDQDEILIDMSDDGTVSLSAVWEGPLPCRAYVRHEHGSIEGDCRPDGSVFFEGLGGGPATIEIWGPEHARATVDMTLVSGRHHEAGSIEPDNGVLEGQLDTAFPLDELQLSVDKGRARLDVETGAFTVTGIPDGMEIELYLFTSGWGTFVEHAAAGEFLDWVIDEHAVR